MVALCRQSFQRYLALPPPGRRELHSELLRKYGEEVERAARARPRALLRPFQLAGTV
jgi:hypothetical protein